MTRLNMPVWWRAASLALVLLATSCGAEEAVSVGGASAGTSTTAGSVGTVPGGNDEFCAAWQQLQDPDAVLEDPFDPEAVVRLAELFDQARGVSPEVDRDLARMQTLVEDLFASIAGYGSAEAFESAPIEELAALSSMADELAEYGFRSAAASYAYASCPGSPDPDFELPCNARQSFQPIGKAITEDGDLVSDGPRWATLEEAEAGLLSDGGGDDPVEPEETRQRPSQRDDAADGDIEMAVLGPDGVPIKVVVLRPVDGGWDMALDTTCVGR